MNIVLMFSLVLSVASFPVMVSAADVPAVVEGDEKYSKEECVASAANDCIQSICLTSSAIDCEEHCKSDAVNKCKESEE